MCFQVLEKAGFVNVDVMDRTEDYVHALNTELGRISSVKHQFLQVILSLNIVILPVGFICFDEIIFFAKSPSKSTSHGHILLGCLHFASLCQHLAHKFEV